MRYSFPHSPPRTHMQHRFFSSAYLYLVLFLFSLQVLTTGWLNRRVASTSMNRESSRSHAVFTLTIQSKKRVGMFTPLLHHLVSPTMLMSSPLPHHVHTLTGEQGFCSQDQNFTAEFGGLSWLRKTARHSHCRTQTEGRTASPLPSFLSLLSLLFLHPHLSPSLSPPHTLTGGREHQQVTLGPRQCDHGSSGHYSRKITTCALPRLKTHLPTQSMSCSVPSTDSWYSSGLALFQAISPDLSLCGGGNNKACSLHHVVQSSATTGVSNLLCMLLPCVEGISTTGLTGWKR